MGNFGSILDSGGGCCEPRVDVITLVTAIGTIAAASVFLRQAVIDNNIMMARRRRSSNTYINSLLLGKLFFSLISHQYFCIDCYHYFNIQICVVFSFF